MQPITMKEGGEWYRFFTRFHCGIFAKRTLVPETTCSFVWLSLFSLIRHYIVMSTVVGMGLALMNMYFEGWNAEPYVGYADNWILPLRALLLMSVVFGGVTLLMSCVAAVVIAVGLILFAIVAGLCWVKENWWDNPDIPPYLRKPEDVPFYKTRQVVSSVFNKFCVPIKWE